MRRQSENTERPRILIVAPSIERTPGGMGHVVRTLLEDEDINRDMVFGYIASHVEARWPEKMRVILVALIRYLATMGRYDVVHIHSASERSFFRKSVFALLAHVCRRNVLFHIHGADFHCFYQELYPLQKRYVRFVLDHVERIVVLSEFWKKQLQSMTTNRSIDTLYNWVNAEELAGLARDRADTNQVLLLGRLGERKGVYDLVKAIPLVLEKRRDARFVLAGDGEIAEVAEQCRAGGIEARVEIPGWVGGEKKLEYLRNAAVFVLPSYHEGLPVALLEAMAAGLPVVSTPVGAIPELIQDGENGFLVEPGDFRLLAQRVILLLGDPELRRRMSRANLQLVRDRFDQGVVFHKLKSIYRSMGRGVASSR